MSNISDHFYDIGVFPIKQNRGIGFEFVCGNDTFITYPDNSKNHPGFRVARLDITSYVGMASDAVHYYGNLKIVTHNVDKANSNHLIGGYLGGAVLPPECKYYDEPIVRILTQSEIDEFPERWETYKAGYQTNRFDSEEEIIELVESLKNEIFNGKWVIIVDGFYTDKEILVDN